MLHHTSCFRNIPNLQSKICWEHTLCNQTEIIVSGRQLSHYLHLLSLLLCRLRPDRSETCWVSWVHSGQGGQTHDEGTTHVEDKHQQHHPLLPNDESLQMVEVWERLEGQITGTGWFTLTVKHLFTAWFITLMTTNDKYYRKQHPVIRDCHFLF